ncbi:MAG TPA: hypothetical protein PKE12_15930 [Kiritimatiellia bacterium]|nr:hypothetical protein [Kiritimatiellia bacterium]
MKINMLACGLAVLGGAVAAQAQVLDLQTGRGADLSGAAKFSVEGGVVAGDADYIGARGNFLVADRVLVGVQVGQVDLGDNETAIGGFAMFQLVTRTPVDIAIKAGFDAVLDGDVDLYEFSGLCIVSKAINEQVLWYANAGMHYVEVDRPARVRVGGVVVVPGDDDDDIVPTLGGGFVFTINDQASAFVGIDALLGDIYDDTVIGAGFRLAFR